MKQSIEQFWLKKRFVLFGMSRKKKSVSREVYELLTSKGYEVFPINPNADDSGDVKCYRSLDDVTTDVDGAVVITNPKISHQVVKACEQKGICDFWFQYDTMDDELKAYLDEKGINWIYSCVLLHHKESGFPHSIHRFFYRLFKG